MLVTKKSLMMKSVKNRMKMMMSRFPAKDIHSSVPVDKDRGQDHQIPANQDSDSNKQDSDVPVNKMSDDPLIPGKLVKKTAVYLARTKTPV